MVAEKKLLTVFRITIGGVGGELRAKNSACEAGDARGEVDTMEGDRL